MESLIIASESTGPGYVPIILGGVGLILVGLFRIVPSDSAPGKAVASFLTRNGQYDLSPARLAVVVAISLGLLAVGIILINTGH